MAQVKEAGAAQNADQKSTNKAANTVSRPWAPEAVDVSRYKTFKTVLKNAGLDFTANKVPLLTEGGDVSPHIVGVQRADNGKLLAAVKPNYEIIQYSDAFKLFEPFVAESDAVFDTAQSMKGGARGFVSMKLPNYISVKGDQSPIELFALAVNSHDRSYACSLVLTPVRAVCENTMRLALKHNQGVVRIKHTRNANSRMLDAAETLGLTNKYFEEIGEMMNALTKVDMTKKKVDAFNDFLFPSNGSKGSETRRANQLEEFSGILHNGIGQNECKQGTGYWYFNALTRMVEEKAGEKEDVFNANLNHYQSLRDNAVKVLLQ